MTKPRIRGEDVGNEVGACSIRDYSKATSINCANMNDFVGKFITLKAFPRGLMVKKLLGEGGFAFVYKVLHVSFSHLPRCSTAKDIQYSFPNDRIQRQEYVFYFCKGQG